MKKSILKSRLAVFFTAFVFLPLFAGCLGSCNIDSGSDDKSNDGIALSIASWNVQALFDEHDDGWEYEEYRDGSGWSEEKYAARLNNIAQAILTIGAKSPDIIAFIEIENKNILDKLHLDYIGKEKYQYSFFAGTPGYSLGIGVMSKIPFIKTIAHSINVEGAIIPRPVAELWIESSDEKMVFFVCHWKSKLGGEAATEKLRREAAKVILRRQRELKLTNPDIPIIVLGDLNENYDEFYRNGSEYICALLPDDPQAAQRAGFPSLNLEDSDEDDEAQTVSIAEPEEQNFLIISEKKPPAASFFSCSEGVFYSPWGNELLNGSYFYNGAWETIDHFLLNNAFFDNRGLEFKNCFVMDCEPFINAKGEPNRYIPRTGSGLSDHLPLLLVLSR